MKEKNVAWQMFVKTGNPSFYSLYKRLSEEDGDTNQQGDMFEERRLR